jgi:hypothetical protein
MGRIKKQYVIKIISLPPELNRYKCDSLELLTAKEQVNKEEKRVTPLRMLLRSKYMICGHMTVAEVQIPRHT